MFCVSKHPRSLVIGCFGCCLFGSVAIPVRQRSITARLRHFKSIHKHKRHILVVYTSTLLIIHLLVFRLFDSICKYIEPACPLVQNAIRFQCCSLKLSTMFCELCILLGLLLSRFKKEKCKKEIELIDKISGCIFVYKYHRNCCCCCPELVTRGLGR